LAPTSEPSVAPGSARSIRSARRRAVGVVSMAPHCAPPLACRLYDACSGLPPACELSRGQLASAC
jgi:hypothetical protein